MPSSSSHDTVLVLNSGSSSLKFGLFRRGADDEEMVLEGSAQGIGKAGGTLQIRAADGNVLLKQTHILESQPDALGKLAQALEKHGAGRPIAVGHRVVHGGPHLRTHQRITARVLEQLREAVHFAPLHIPPALALVEQAQQIWDVVPHFACFDHAFHQTMPPAATRLPLPDKYAAAGVIHYGFHGLSYESLVYRLGKNLPSRAVFAHLGNGSSLCAVQNGKSIDTSMGLTPTGGVPMSTRSGDLDPGVLLYLMRTEGLDADGLERLLNRESGLAGLSGGQGDMQALLASKDAGAALAVDAFVRSVRKYVGAYAALMGGVDLLVFTGGIGEHSAEVRRRVVDGLGFMGVTPGERVMVVPTEEERQMARHCRGLLGRDGK
jgi:acetate kinase